MVDEYTPEALAMHVARSIDAPSTVSVFEGLLAERRSPAHIRCDNGTELTSHTLKDWCTSTHTEIAYVQPGSPWQNGYVEWFNARVRDELLDIEEFSCLAEARVLIEDYQEDFNHRRPHSSLGMRTPVSFAAEHGVAAATLGTLAITNPDPVLELAA